MVNSQQLELPKVRDTIFEALDNMDSQQWWTETLEEILTPTLGEEAVADVVTKLKRTCGARRSSARMAGYYDSDWNRTRSTSATGRDPIGRTQ